MSDPDVEVRVYPGPGKDPRQLLSRPRTRFSHRHGPELRMTGQAPIERPEKRPSTAFEVFPGVLAIQDDRDERLSPAGPLSVAAARPHEAGDGVRRRRFPRPPRIA